MALPALDVSWTLESLEKRINLEIREAWQVKVALEAGIQEAICMGLESRLSVPKRGAPAQERQVAWVSANLGSAPVRIQLSHREANEGTISFRWSVHSEWGKGAYFRICLPPPDVDGSRLEEHPLLELAIHRITILGRGRIRRSQSGPLGMEISFPGARAAATFRVGTRGPMAEELWERARMTIRRTVEESLLDRLLFPTMRRGIAKENF